jgi:flagellar assembly protein FliH
VAILKRNGPLDGAIVLDLGDLERQAQAIVESARREAERIVAAAEAQAQALVVAADGIGAREGRARGYEEGSAAGRADGRAAALAEHGASIERLGAAWTEALETWERQRATMLEGARTDIVELALALARKVVVQVAASDPRTVERQLEETLAMIARPSCAAVVVHPDDKALAEEVLPAIIERLDAVEHALLEVDPAISRGGCVVRCGRGVIDATIERQLERIAQALLPARAPEGASRSAPEVGSPPGPDGAG